MNVSSDGDDVTVAGKLFHIAYIWRNDVTASMVTIRSPLCGYRGNFSTGAGPPCPPPLAPALMFTSVLSNGININDLQSVGTC